MESDIVIRTRGLSEGRTQIIRDELHLLAKACDDKLTPEIILENAKSKSSPIHDYFIWDDTVAGERFRLLQAAMLMRTVKALVETHPQDKPKMVRAFVSVVTQSADGEASNVYVPLSVALKVEDYRDQMLENAFRDLRAFQRKYSVLKELAKVFDSIEQLVIPV